MRTALIRAAVALAAGLSLGVVADSPASAGHGPPNHRVSGIAVFGDGVTCPGLDLQPSAEGWSLDGCLYITSITREHWNPSGTYQEEGTEHFEGDLVHDGVVVGSGTFDTEYLFRAKFGEIGNFATEIHGFCQHPITGGTGVFDGVDGRLAFKDVLDGPGAPYFPYRGNIQV